MTVRTGPCEPWATPDDLDVCSPCADLALDDATKERWLAVASELLFVLSGRKFAGPCEATGLRPCRRTCVNFAGFYTSGWTDIGDRPRLPSAPQEWPASSCGCGFVPQVSLGRYPILDVSEVRIDGAILAPSAYRLERERWLVRIDGEQWPSCQDLLAEDTEVGTWAVDATYGYLPPASGVEAAAALACELALSCSPNADKCRLPRRVQTITRNNVTMTLLDPTGLIDEKSGFGIPVVDSFLRTFGSQAKRHRSGQVFSPDTMQRARRV